MRLTSLKLNSLRDLFIEELRDLHDAETQLVKALPKMADAATDIQLKAALNTHLGQTKMHVNRLEEIFHQLDEKPTGETCRAMKGLIEESRIFIDAGGDDAVRDAGLIGAAQRVEHYEMAGYGTARALAQHLGENAAVNILQQTLDEESVTDRILTDIAEHEVNLQAAH
jgi:ferritin-like metal-binding protein YciE